MYLNSFACAFAIGELGAYDERWMPFPVKGAVREGQSIYGFRDGNFAPDKT